MPRQSHDLKKLVHDCSSLNYHGASGPSQHLHVKCHQSEYLHLNLGSTGYRTLGRVILLEKRNRAVLYASSSRTSRGWKFQKHKTYKVETYERRSAYRNRLSALNMACQHLTASHSVSSDPSHLISFSSRPCHLTSSHPHLILVTSPHLISSHLISSRLVSSRLVSSRLVSSRLVSSRLVSSHLISSHLISSHLILISPVLASSQLF